MGLRWTHCFRPASRRAVSLGIVCGKQVVRTSDDTDYRLDTEERRGRLSPVGERGIAASTRPAGLGRSDPLALALKHQGAFELGERAHHREQHRHRRYLRMTYTA